MQQDANDPTLSNDQDTLSTPAPSRSLARNLDLSFSETSSLAQASSRIQQIPLPRSSTRRSPATVQKESINATVTEMSSEIRTNSDQMIARPRVSSETMSWAAPFTVAENIHPDLVITTYNVLEKAMQNQNEEAKMRVKSISLPAISSYPKILTSDFSKCKRHF